MDAALLPSRSEFLRIRGLRYHVRRWGRPEQPMIVLLHGWLDVSQTFHFMVQPLLDRWQVIAPDWRGFGSSEWQPGGYWFQDYLADCEALLDHYAPQQPVTLIGHSMGAQVASLYAGLRPPRIDRLVCLDGPFLRDTQVEDAPKRLVGWLDQLRKPLTQKSYGSFDELAARIAVQHPRLTPEHTRFIAECWGQEDGDGNIRLCADPQHRITWPTLYRFADTEPVWRCITAPTLFVDAAHSGVRWIDDAEMTRRRACVRDHRVARIDGSGHMLHFDQPAATAAAIRAFLDS